MNYDFLKKWNLESADLNALMARIKQKYGMAFYEEAMEAMDYGKQETEEEEGEK